MQHIVVNDFKTHFVELPGELAVMLWKYVLYLPETEYNELPDGVRYWLTTVYREVESSNELNQIIKPIKEAYNQQSMKREEGEINLNDIDFAEELRKI